jgi:hypothetical protein
MFGYRRIDQTDAATQSRRFATATVSALSVLIVAMDVVYPGDDMPWATNIGQCPSRLSL